MDKWLPFVAAAKQERKGPKIIVGMPTAISGGGHLNCYRTPGEVAKIYEVY